jgi:VWFA-related protein
MPRKTALTLALVVGAAGWICAGQQQPMYRVDKHAVPIYATVIDATGRLVPDLTRDDFEIRDNGERQPVTQFSNDVQPITIVIMLDRSGSMVSNFGIERDAAGRFVDRLLPADKARLGSFSNRVQIDPPAFTSDTAELKRILHDNLQDAGPTPLWNATGAAMSALKQQPGRKVVMLFTDGEDNPYYKGANTTLGEVRTRAVAEDVMVYAIGLADGCDRDDPATAGQTSGQQRGPNGPQGRGGPPIIIKTPKIPGTPPGGGDGVPRPRPPDPGVFGKKDPDKSCEHSKPDAGLRTLADEAGGGYFELDPTHDLGAAFARVAEELHRQYLIAFTPSTLDGKTHTIEIRVKKAGLTARARKSYVAATEK